MEVVEADLEVAAEVSIQAVGGGFGGGGEHGGGGGGAR